MLLKSVCDPYISDYLSLQDTRFCFKWISVSFSFQSPKVIENVFYKRILSKKSLGSGVKYHQQARRSGEFLIGRKQKVLN